MDVSTAYRRRWLILAVLSLSLVVIGLDNLIIVMALPSMQVALAPTSEQLQWTVDAYTLSFGGLLLCSGGLGDRFGRRRLLLAGLVVFLCFSVAAAFAPSAGALIATRAGMGAGGALIMPSTLAIIKDVFPLDEQGRAIGIWAGAAGLGVPLGPLVGGVLLNSFWWGSVFLINVVIVGGALLAAVLIVPESRDAQHPGLDLVGVVLSLTGLLALVYGLIAGPQRGWTDPVTLGTLAGGSLLLIGFMGWERRAAYPMLTAELFRDARFGGPVAAITCAAFTMMGMFFVLTQYLQFAVHHEPLQAGVRLLGVMTIVLTAPLGPRLVERLGLKATVITGLVLIAGSAALLATVDTAAESRAILSVAVFGLGLGLTLPPCANSILAAAPRHQSGAGSSVTDVALQVGGAMGVAVMGSVLTSAYRNGLPELAGLPDTARSAVEGSLGGAIGVAAQLGQAGSALLHSAEQAFVDAMGVTLLLGFAVAALGAVLAMLVLPGRRVVVPARELTSPVTGLVPLPEHTHNR